MDSTTVVAIFGGLNGLIVAGTATFVVWNGRNIHTELKTINSLKPGGLLDATETRRVEAIPHDERTEQEQDHLDASPKLGPPQGPTVRERTEAIYDAVNGKPSDQPPLYIMVQTIDIKVNDLIGRVDRLTELVGSPPEPGSASAEQGEPS